MSGDGAPLRTEPLTLQTILPLGDAAYERSHPLPDYVRRAVSAMLAGRTAVLGGHVQACPDGHSERVWYHAWRHRLCPQCAWGQVERWLLTQKGRLLACDHSHGIFTMPHALTELWLANVTVMTPLLVASVHDPVCELLGDAQYLGARPGIIATLHTWTQTLLLPPHIHGLVTGGGLHETGPWVAVRHGDLLPVRVRGWGLYAHTQGAALAVCRQQLGQGPVEAPPPWEWQRACAERGEAHPERCPVCGQRLVGTTLIPRAGLPPPAAADGEQVA